MPNPGSPLLPSWLSPRFLSSYSKESTDHYEGARAKVAAFINAPRPEEVVFARNATEGGHASCAALARLACARTPECSPTGGLSLPLLAGPVAAQRAAAAQPGVPPRRHVCHVAQVCSGCRVWPAAQQKQHSTKQRRSKVVRPGAGPPAHGPPRSAALLTCRAEHRGPRLGHAPPA